ncbi:MAG TPA: Coq4 family protein [Myxococcota bacterium]|nr:Coq4 family protein [Myxococcota bacterium]
MTATPVETLPTYARRRRRARPQWSRAWRALRTLLDDPDATENAFEVIAALEPDQMERGLARMLAHPEGRRLFLERPALLPRLCDRDALAALPEGSLGRAYLAHLDRFGLDPSKLVMLDRGYAGEMRTEGEAERWFAERASLSHDLWHVLTGYGADGHGETALLWFTFGQSGGLGIGFLMLGAAWRSDGGRGWWLYLLRAWRRGRHAGCLGALPWEDLLAEPLAKVRSLAGIEPPERAHRGGIRVDPSSQC